MTGLFTAISGLKAAQTNLYVTGHNVANHSVRGYTRQMLHQAHSVHRTIGQSPSGALQIGLGTTMTGIRQIRNHWFDVEFRAAVPRMSYWETRAATHMELDAIFGELQGHYRLHLALEQFNRALNELNNDPASRDTRANFISQAVTFIDRANAAARSLEEYQLQLNDDVISTVQRINQILTDVADLNGRILEARNMGLNPNDFLDWRNNLLDELSSLLDITINEEINGSVSILVTQGGHELLNSAGMINRLGLRQAAPMSPLVEPVFSQEERQLEFGEPARPLFNWHRLGNNYTEHNGAERGHLLSLITSRGMGPANYRTLEIPETQADVIARFNTAAAGATQAERDIFIDFLNQHPDTRFRADIPAVAGMSEAELRTFVHDFDLVSRRTFDMNVAIIPQVKAQFDTLINHIVTMFNTALTEGMSGSTLGPPQNQQGQSHVDGGVPDLRLFQQIRPNDGYTLGNLRVNPDFIAGGGPSLLPLTFEGESDNRLTLYLMTAWNRPDISFGNWSNMGINTFYRQFITLMATGGDEAFTSVRATAEEIDFIDSRRMSVSAVSMEEEMSNMIRFQHAYNSSSRMINTMDSMLDRIINGIGAGRG
ncbi:MAG: flagellar basal body protein [Clostridiales bacterium]|nr:flagellar basal body protein [Clostridiales bacterium]